MKKYILSIVALAFAMVATMTSCSDVELENAPYSEPVSNIQYTVQKSNLIFTWTNPTGSTGTAIFKDGTQISAVGEGVTTDTIKNAADNQTHYYTLKAIYGNEGRISAGVTDTIYLESKTKAAFLLTVSGDYTSLPDDDEIAAAEWFDENYVQNSTGVFIHLSDLASLDIDEISEVWVMIDRVGIGSGVDKLPLTTANLNSLKAYVQAGGNLFLTKHATQIVAGIERVESRFTPNIFGDGAGGDGSDHWVMNSVIGCKQGEPYDHRSHQIFLGLDEADPNNYGFPTFPLEGPGFREDHNCMWDLNAFGFSGTPNVVKNWEEATNSTVLATWGHVSDYCCAGIVEFEPTTTYKGRVVAIGLSAYEFKQNAPSGATQNIYQKNTELLTKNCIDYMK